MPGTEIVTHITAETMAAVIEEEDKPVLLACIRNDANLRENLTVLDTVAVYAGPSIRVCYATEDLFSVTATRYQVTGTPTFLVIRKGALLDSLLGRTTPQALMQFLKGTLEAELTRARSLNTGQETL